MKTYNYFRSTRVLALACLAFAMRAQAGPEYTPNMVVETSAPGLARLEVQLSSKEWQESRYFVFEGKGSIVGGIALPEKYAAEYSITAYDEEGKPINSGKGPLPPVAVLDKPLDIPLPPIEKGDGLVLSLNRERIALEVQPFKESAEEIVVHADVFDAAGNPAKLDPGQIYWQLSDGRQLQLLHGWEPGDIHVKPDKGLVFAELCPLEPVVTLCRLNSQCKPIRICKDPWVQISAGANHTCALKESGAAFCWGLNIDGQLGAPTTTSCSPNTAFGSNCSTRPLPVVCPAGSPCRFRQIAAGATLTVAVDVDGDVWWWGRGLPDHHKVSAVLAGSPVKFSLATAGYGHGCAISQSRSEIWCWGANGWSTAGVPHGNMPGGTWEVPDWAPVRVLAPLKFRKVVARSEHTCAIGSTSTDVVCWGRDDLKQSSGPNPSTFQLPGGIPYHFQLFGGLVNIQDVAVSSSSSCVTLGNGNGVKCWGEHRLRNVAAFGMPDSMAAGFAHVCALTALQARCLGTNFWGEVGIGNNSQQLVPVTVNAPPASFAQISTGESHTCGITPEGDAFCWGRNGQGQGGTGATSFSEQAPRQVTTP